MPLFEHRRRVRYVDTDQFQAAHHSRTILWFEEVRTELLRHLGRPYQTFENAGLFFPVRECGARYRGLARFDDLLVVTIDRVDVTGASLRFDYQVRGETGAIAEGFTVHACVGRDRRVRRIPDEVRRLFQPPS